MREEEEKKYADNIDPFVSSSPKKKHQWTVEEEYCVVREMQVSRC